MITIGEHEYDRLKEIETKMMLLQIEDVWFSDGTKRVIIDFPPDGKFQKTVIPYQLEANHD